VLAKCKRGQRYTNIYFVCLLIFVQDKSSGDDLSVHEILEVANEVEERGKTSELRRVLERSDDPECTSAKLLLSRWLQEMKAMGKPPRSLLMNHLANMGMFQDLHSKLV
jgi:hypothetical protein